MKFYILKKVKEGKTFTHPWTNDNDDFFDGHKYSNVEDFLLNEGYTNGTDPIYKWTEIDSSRIQRNGLDTAIMSIDETTKLESDNYFVKMVPEDGDKELTLYYYNVDVTDPSNQNNDLISYALLLQLDYWSTFGSYMNEDMMSFPADVLFLRKHANRFLFDEENEKGFWFDYLLQPYLARGEFKGYQLVRDLEEEGLDLETWKYINTDSAKNNISFEDWWTQTYYPWMRKPWAGSIYAAADINHYPDGEKKGLGKKIAIKNGTKYWQNANAYAFDYVPDWYYNSNGLYRWLVLKTGKYLVDFNPQTGEKIKGNTLIDRTKFDLARNGYKPSGTILDFRNKSESERRINDDVIEYDHYDMGDGYEKYTIDIIKTFDLTEPFSETEYHYWKNENWILQDDTGNENCHRFDITFTQEDGTVWTLWFGAWHAIVPIVIHHYWTPFVTKRAFNGPDMWLKANQWSQIGHKTRTEDNEWEKRVEFRCPGKKDIDMPIWKQDNPKTWQSWVETGIFGQNQVKLRIHFEIPIVKAWLPNVKEVKCRVTAPMPFFTPNQTWSYVSAPEIKTLAYPVTADTLVLLPVQKTIPIDAVQEETEVPSFKSTSKTIYSLFNSIDVTPGSSSFVGSLINEIPMEILALASRKNTDRENSYGYSALNLTSCREAQDATYKPCPEDIQLLITTQGGSKDPTTGKITDPSGYMSVPCLFSDLSYIPVTIARAPLTINEENKTALGGNNFINSYYDLLSNNELTKHNTLYSDPIMYSPDIWQWKYLIDGTNEITVVGAYLNFYNMIQNPDWEINLNVAMSNATYYKVDLGKLKSVVYPFSKSFSELISHDNRKFTQYTEDYFNWLQNNQSTYDAAKVGFEINSKRAMLESTLGGAMSGAGAGAQIGGNIAEATASTAKRGALIGGVIGAGLGAIGASIAKKYNKQLFDLSWRTRFKNMATSPLTAVENGFSTGSLNYATWENPTFFDRQLLRTYRPSVLDRKAIWYDFCWKGYWYYGMDKFSAYDNRKKFNYMEIDTSLDSLLIKHLKNKMCQRSLLFSQTKFIDWFLSKLSGGIRLFKCDFDTNVEKYEDYEYASIVLNNIENEYQEPYTSYSGDSVIFRDMERDDPKLYSIIKNK